MRKIFTCFLLVFLTTPLFGCGDQSGEVLSDNATSTEQTFLKEDVEPLEVKEISDDVVINIYDDYQVVVADGGKMEVRLPLEVEVKESSYDDALFSAYIYGETQIIDGGLFDGAGITMNRFDISRTADLKMRKDISLIDVNGEEVIVYEFYDPHPEPGPPDTTLSYYFTESGYSMHCVATGLDMQKYVDLCKKFFSQINVRG